MTTASSSTARMWVTLAAISCASAALHLANLVYLADRFDCELPRLSCPGPTPPWVTPDTASYRAVAEDIARRGVLHASYLQRTPGFPALLALSQRASGEAATLLWFVPLLAAAACAAIGWLAFRFAGTTRAALIASLLFCAWPATYQLAPILITDAVHAYLAVIAFAATEAWLRDRRASVGCLAAALWMAAQSVRPTFFLLPLFLPILLWRSGQTRKGVWLSLGIWLASAIVPTLIVTSNYVQHGVAIVSAIEPTTLAAYAVPRLKEELGLGSALALRDETLERHAAIAEPRERVALQRREAWEFLSSHPGPAFRSFARELARQMFARLRPVWPGLEARASYPTWLPRQTIHAFWICAALGTALLAGRQPRTAIFLICAFAAVMLPASASHWVGGRLRFPIDLMFMPVAVLFLDRFWTRLRRATFFPS